MKQITISSDAYDIFESWKIEKESFSEAILRIQERKKIKEKMALY